MDLKKFNTITDPAKFVVNNTKEGRVTILKAEKVLDTTGLLCPLPIVKTSKAIREIEVGQILQVIATDPGALSDMEAWSRQTGHELLQSSEVGGKYIFYLRRSK